jgi:hypothetical protein
MPKDDMAARHKALIDECNAPNTAWTGTPHLKPHDFIERERQTRLLAAILEKLHG